MKENRMYGSGFLHRPAPFVFQYVFAPSSSWRKTDMLPACEYREKQAFLFSSIVAITSFGLLSADSWSIQHPCHHPYLPDRFHVPVSHTWHLRSIHDEQPDINPVHSVFPLAVRMPAPHQREMPYTVNLIKSQPVTNLSFISF